jgi:hypothetical protein
MLMRQKHWLAQLLVLKVRDIHDLMSSYIAQPVGPAVERRQSQEFLLRPSPVTSSYSFVAACRAPKLGLRFDGQGRKQLGMQADRTKEPAKRSADSGIVIDQIDVLVVYREFSGGTLITERAHHADVARIEA